MKTIKLTGKLSLKKEVISKLNNEQMQQIQGGSGTVGQTCWCSSNTQCDVSFCINTCSTCWDPTCIMETCPTGAC